MVWSRWPTAGPPGHVETAADYDAMVAELIASGTISDPGMVYFDIRPSAHLPTVELRVCDACPDVEEVVLIAGSSAPWSAAPAPTSMRAFRSRTTGTSCCARAAGVRHAPGWRATSSTSTARTWSPAAAHQPARAGPATALEELGDWEQVLALSEATLTKGSAAARQRRTFGRRGELTDVVDALLARTQGHDPVLEPPDTVPARPELLAAYHPGAYDEAVGPDGEVLPQYGWMFRRSGASGAGGWSPRSPRCAPSSGHAG